MQTVILPKNRRRRIILVDTWETRPRPSNKTHFRLVCAMVFPIWDWCSPVHGLAPSLAQWVPWWGRGTSPSGEPHKTCPSAESPSPGPLTANALLRHTPMVPGQKKTTHMQNFYKFGHCDQTLLPILWSCDKSLGIKQHGDHRGYYVYCAEQTVIIH